jgi:hypothetical protein
MNLETMNDHIRYFSREIVESGFKRDIDDYIASLPSHQSDVVTLRDLASKVLNDLEHIYQSDLPYALQSLLPRSEPPIFTVVRHDEVLRKLIKDTEIELPQFFAQLSASLTQLQSQLVENQAAIEKVKVFISPYISEEEEEITEENIAIISIVFKERETITSLKQFTKTLSAWNRILPVYHQLVQSGSPEDIEIVEVQNGSIDFVVNLDVNVALDLVELFKLGFAVFGSYLSYKKMAKPFIDACHGNQKLIKLEKEKEKILLENIGTAINREILAQHKKAKKADSKVDGTAIAKKADQVTNLITSHIVKGNDFKLLALPEAEEVGEGEVQRPDEREVLREQSMIARRELRQIPISEQRKLLEEYGKIDDEAE